MSEDVRGESCGSVIVRSERKESVFVKSGPVRSEKCEDVLVKSVLVKGGVVNSVTVTGTTGK